MDSERFGNLFRALRVLSGVALWGALALFALFLAALAINAFDERPSRETLALLQPPVNRYAPAGQSVIAVGQAVCLRQLECDAERRDGG